MVRVVKIYSQQFSSADGGVVYMIVMLCFRILGRTHLLGFFVFNCGNSWSLSFINTPCILQEEEGEGRHQWYAAFPKLIWAYLAMESFFEGVLETGHAAGYQLVKVVGGRHFTDEKLRSKWLVAQVTIAGEITDCMTLRSLLCPLAKKEILQPRKHMFKY